MRTHYDENYWKTSKQQRLREASDSLDKARRNLERSRSRLMERREVLLTVEAAGEIASPLGKHDPFGKPFKVDAVQILLRNDSECKLRFDQYLLDYRNYLIASMEYERLRDEGSSFAPPTTAPRGAATTSPRTPRGQTARRAPDAEEPAIIRGLKRRLLQDLTSAVVALDRSSTRENASEVLTQVARAQLLGMEDHSLVETGIRRVGDYAEAQEKRAEETFREAPTKVNFRRRLRDLADAQMLGRCEEKLEETGKPPTRVKSGIKHVVRKGDTLSRIAMEYYGDVSRWDAIYLKNHDRIGDDPDRILPEVELDLP